MSKIKILPSQIVNKIAAGEVVERPASVVKELLENAVDAGASEIKVRVVDGGKKKIVVTDNGKGMDKNDLKLCLKRHSTSKIKNEYDLLKIKSLGFRGEALSSIASVSKTTIRSKTKESDTGYELYSEGGKQNNPKPYGMPEGTQVVVEDLFYNVPARKKFLRTTQTEFRHILEIIDNTALAFTNIALSLSHNKKSIFRLPKNQTPKERIHQLLGKTIAENLLSVFFDHPHLQIKGYVVKPQFAQTRSDKQYIFVNQRRVADRLVTGAVKQAFSTLLPANSYPVFILFLKLPAELVDVNVHPRKEEVKFINGSFVYTAIKQTVEFALQRKDLTFIKQAQTIKDKSYSYLEKSLHKDAVSISHNQFPWRAEFPQTSSRMEPRFNQGSFIKLEQEPEIAQFHNLYLATQTKNGILLIDQHAAHERVLYEYFLQEYKTRQKQKNIQPLLVPVILDVSFSEAEIIKEYKPILQSLGFQIDEFGNNSFKISEIPQILQQQDISSVLLEVVDDLAEEKMPREINTKARKAISYLACRSAVKAGDPLTQAKRREILDKLKQTKTEYTCPHGRPVKIEFSLGELEKMFRRRQ